MPKMLAAQNRKLTWVTTIVDLSAPTVAELEAGVDLECLVSAQNFQLGATDEEEITDPAICSNSNSSTPGRVKYAAEMDFFRWTTDPEDIAWTTFTEAGLHGFLVQRLGVQHDAAYAASQDVQVYEAVTGTPMIQTPDNNVTGYEKFREKFYIQDQVDEHAVVHA